MTSITSGDPRAFHFRFPHVPRVWVQISHSTNLTVKVQARYKFCRIQMSINIELEQDEVLAADESR